MPFSICSRKAPHREVGELQLHWLADITCLNIIASDRRRFLCLRLLSFVRESETPSDHSSPLHIKLNAESSSPYEHLEKCLQKSNHSTTWKSIVLQRQLGTTATTAIKTALIIVIVALVFNNTTGVSYFNFVSATAHVRSPGSMYIHQALLTFVQFQYFLFVGSQQSVLHVQVDGSPESSLDMQRCFVRILVVILGTTFLWPACLRRDMLMWYRSGQSIRQQRALHISLLCII